MTSRWISKITIIDKVANNKTKIHFSFPPYYTYNRLYDHIPTLLKIVGWEAVNMHKYQRRDVIFEKRVCSHNMKIGDWDNFILHRDKITITLLDSNSYYYGVYSKSLKMLMIGKNLPSIYQRIDQFLPNKTLLIYLIDGTYKRVKLIDVLDNPIRYHNRVINRLIHNYYIPYGITI